MSQITHVRLRLNMEGHEYIYLMLAIYLIFMFTLQVYSFSFAFNNLLALYLALKSAPHHVNMQAKRLKAIMLAAAELTALRLRDLPSANHRGRLEIDHNNRIFRFLDKNGDGRISIEELTEVMEELGAGDKDAQELMQLLDANSDGSLSSDEFALLQRQVKLDILNA